LPPTALADAARQNEAAGFKSAWVFDAIGRLHHLCALGFDDVVMVARRHDAPYLKTLRDLAVSAR